MISTSNSKRKMSVSPSAPVDPDKPLKDFSTPIWLNAHWARSSLEMYDGISMHAGEINKTNHGHFFGLAQQLSLDGAVIAICKLYDTSNPRYEKHTIPELLKFFEDQFSQDQARYVGEKDMIQLGIESQDAKTILTKMAAPAEYADARNLLITKLKEKMPTADNNPSLKRLVTYRNKVGAHQEQLDEALKATLRALPPLEKMEELADWAENFCHFIMNILSTSTTYVRSCISAKMAALNVAAKILDKNFDENKDYAARNKFYGISD